jgi:hypothetical protein
MYSPRKLLHEQRFSPSNLFCFVTWSRELNWLKTNDRMFAPGSLLHEGVLACEGDVLECTSFVPKHRNFLSVSISMGVFINACKCACAGRVHD